MALQHITHVRPKQLLPPRPHSLHKRPDQTQIAAPVPSTLVPGCMPHGRLLAKISDGERVHVAHDLAKRKMQARLAVADEPGVGDHGERRGGAGGELEVDDLVVADVVVAFVHALAVARRAEGVGDVLDVGEPVDDRVGGPACGALLDWFEVDFGRVVSFILMRSMLEG